MIETLVQMLRFWRHQDSRGALEAHNNIPFAIQRVYYLYDMPGEAVRGGHAHRMLQQVLVALHGSFDVFAEEGHDSNVFHLGRADEGLFIPRLVWRELRNFSSGAVCLVLASQRFDPDDYLHDYPSFLRLVPSRAAHAAIRDPFLTR